jgi:hypothetical protein
VAAPPEPDSADPFLNHKGHCSKTRPAAAYLSRYLDLYHPHRIVAVVPLRLASPDRGHLLPRDGRELAARNQAISYELLAIHEKSPLLGVLRDNPRFLRVNREDRGAELLIWRRLY